MAGGLLIGGVANAATPTGSMGNVTALPIIGDPSDDIGGLDPGQIIDPILDPILGGLLGGTGGLVLGTQWHILNGLSSWPPEDR